MSEFDFARLGAAFLLVIGLIAMCGWLAKRSGLQGARGKSTDVRVLSRTYLGARSSIVVVGVEDARLVLGITPSSINLLHTLCPDTASTTSEESAQIKRTAFQSVLQNFRGPEK